MKINKLVFVISVAVLAGCAQKQAKNKDTGCAISYATTSRRSSREARG